MFVTSENKCGTETGRFEKIGNNDLFADNNEVRFRKLYRDLRFAGGICLPCSGGTGRREERRSREENATG